MTHFEMNQGTLSSVFISTLIGIYWVLTSGQVLGVEVWTGDTLIDQGQMVFKNYGRSQIITQLFTPLLITRSLGRKLYYFVKTDKERYD